MYICIHMYIYTGDHDETLCPIADTADDGVTRLSCNQFGGQVHTLTKTSHITDTNSPRNSDPLRFNC